MNITKLKHFLRKNRATKTFYVFLHKAKQSRNRKALQGYYVEATKAIHDAFENSDLQYACSSGSLLGIVRDNKFMEHDNDIDLMVVVDSYKDFERVPEVVMNCGFKLLHYYMVDKNIVEYTFMYRNTGLTIDFFSNLKHNSTTTLYWLYQEPGKEYADNSERSVSMFTFPEISSYEYIDLWGVDLRIPANSNDILECLYGLSWRIKDEKYNSKNAPGHKYTNHIGYQVDV